MAQRALDYLSNSNMGASRDTQLRMLGIVRFMLANLHGEDDIFGFGHDVMRSRWLRLSAVVSRSRRISLQKIMPQYCTYFNRVREPSPGERTFGKLTLTVKALTAGDRLDSLRMGEVREGGRRRLL